MTDLARANDLLAALEQPHHGGHYCPAVDSPTSRGTWIPFRDVCPARHAVAELRVLVENLHRRTHDAAHDPQTVDVVASAMLAGTPLADLSPEVAEGWRTMARLAIEGLATHLTQ